jgi:hypothetical protein
MNTMGDNEPEDSSLYSSFNLIFVGSDPTGIVGAQEILVIDRILVGIIVVIG